MLSAKPRDFRNQISYLDDSATPKIGNRLLPIDSLVLNIEQHLTCRYCKEKEWDEFAEFLRENNSKDRDPSKLLEVFRKSKKEGIKVIEHTVGIATKIGCKCTHCGLLFETSRCRSKFPNNKHEYSSTEPFSMNVTILER